MAGSILTPNSIWGDLVFEVKPTAKTIYTVEKDGLIFERFYIEGLNVLDKPISIYAYMIRPQKTEKTPLVFVAHDFFIKENQKIDFEFLRQGYSVVSVDFAGVNEFSQYYTKYPEELNYANFINAKDNLFTIDNEVKNSCWYVWASVAKYAIRYFASLKNFSTLGVYSFGEVNTILWQAVATENKGVDCAVFCMNAGWTSYRKYYKYSTTAEPLFPNDVLKYIAGVEAQSYATYIKCPTLVLSSTNNRDFDMDRIEGTLFRTDEKVYTCTYYSVNLSGIIDNEGWDDLNIFYSTFLKKTGTKSTLNKDVEVKCEIKDGKIEIKASTKEEFDSLVVYVSEEVVKPSNRAWELLEEYKEVKKGVYLFEYTPHKYSGMVTVFAKMKGKQGFTTCSSTVAKRFTENEIEKPNFRNILYTSREGKMENTFAPFDESYAFSNEMDVENLGKIKRVKGAMGIYGMTSNYGVITYKLALSKFKPKDDSIFMFDIYLPEGGEVEALLITDTGETKTYTARANLVPGNIWHNVKFIGKNFKTSEGMGLKTYENVIAFALKCDKKYVVNNILWV